MEEALRKALSQAALAISAAGHHPSCQFRGCTCGTVEDFKVQSSEFWRQFKELKK